MAAAPNDASSRGREEGAAAAHSLRERIRAAPTKAAIARLAGSALQAILSASKRYGQATAYLVGFWDSFMDAAETLRDGE